ncbi:MAG: hypothetical protein K2Q03_04020 [Sphingobacteriaceae bacterium]|nr:hypothetical protein [Sphingobacteriaceae bacterium]
MAHAWQNAESGKRRYSKSSLKLRNDKLKLGASISAVCIGDIDVEKLVGNPCTMTAADYVKNKVLVGEHIDAGQAAYFLTRDEFNKGEFLPVEIYDVVLKQEAKSGLLEFDVLAGLILVKADTLIYWK